jgi:hypothetical protein
VRICFVGHVFHGRTRSSAFIQSILRELGEVTVLSSSPDDAGGIADDEIVEHYRQNAYDLWVFWQTEYVAARLLPLGLRNAVIAPMYDGAAGRPDAFFQQFVNCRFAAFSRELHARFQRLGLRSLCFEYWPPLPEGSTDVTAERQDWSAFFWERRPLEVPNAPLVLEQCQELGIPRLHIHAAPDFAADAAGTASYRTRGRILGIETTTSTWFEDVNEYHAVSAGALFYFAPRLSEGIGMAMLEAMARGQVVVAPDRPTANQYIGHLSSGILYDPDRPLELPRLTEASVREMSAAARTRVAFGREEWERDVERLRSFLLDDGRRWAGSDVSAHFLNGLQRAMRQRRLKSASGSTKMQR